MRPYHAYVFDLDGTIYLGDELLPGARDTVAALRRAGRRTLFLSNNPTKTRDEYAAKLSGMGIPTPVDDIVTSALVMGQWLRANAPDARLYVVGEEPLKAELRAAGLTLSDTPGAIDIVVASFDRTFGDRYCPVPGGGEPDAAAIIAAIEACTLATCDPIVGKPSPIMVATIMQMLELPPERCIMVGDRLETDMRMGLAAGMDTALVLTGDADRAKLAASGLTPTYVLERIDELLAA
jgi:ribonucleotide monophosphatase NagD (HAD superfamily)